MENNRLYGSIGLAMKAGAVVSGDFAAEKTLTAGKAKLVLLDTACSEATRERYAHLCARRGIRILYVEDLGDRIGKPGRKIAAVTDENFQTMILRAAGQN